MPDYEKMYYELFNKITDAIEILKQAQKNAEEKFVSSDNQ